MRRRSWPALLLLALLPLRVAAEPSYPALTGRVVDQAGVLSSSVRERLTAGLEAFEKASSNQIVVVTLASLQGTAIEDFGVGLGRAWGIGQKGQSNGALLIVAPNERQVRIEVGYGLEDRLTDAMSHDIIENRILPAFRQGELEAGIEAGVAGILAALGGKYDPATKIAKAPQSEGSWPAFIIFPMFVVFFLWRSYARRRRFGVVGPWIGPGLGGGFGSSRGFSSGGGGGFRGGGGSFGGGGASGRW